MHRSLRQRRGRRKQWPLQLIAACVEIVTAVLGPLWYLGSRCLLRHCGPPKELGVAFSTKGCVASSELLGR